ncbi:hypothetical protein BDB00DRAFT_852941 [Zychaea mexicana]|uniref:uncharacterized protein n=1 Tax=Zychaea mexicana TaxID=64656 RepID=UPI0022FE83D7|nr:uncharacterized protein BDB00DRAFT_852941 [Zychaea mexicana]KAI9484868.1 hypothetical protein BDB00DRAFT_852941 [Zychaea mexicana]
MGRQLRIGGYVFNIEFARCLLEFVLFPLSSFLSYNPKKKTIMTVIDSDNRHAKKTRDQLAYLKTLTESLDSWDFVSEQDGVKLYTKDIPDSPLPIVRGDTVRDDLDCSPQDIVSAAVLPGCRAVWDEQFDTSDIKELYTRYESLFWVKMKAPWPVSPRDISGTSIRDYSDDVVFMSMTSVEDGLNPPDPECVRANLVVSGWKFYKTQDNKIGITYITQIDLGGYIPYWLLKSIQTSIPLCAGKLADYVKERGFPPNTRVCTGKFLGETLEEKEDGAIAYNVQVDGGEIECLVSGKMFPTIQVHVDGQAGEPEVVVEEKENKVVRIKAIQGQVKIRLTR